MRKPRICVHIPESSESCTRAAEQICVFLGTATRTRALDLCSCSHLPPPHLQYHRPAQLTSPGVLVVTTTHTFSQSRNQDCSTLSFSLVPTLVFVGSPWAASLVLPSALSFNPLGTCSWISVPETYYSPLTFLVYILPAEYNETFLI